MLNAFRSKSNCEIEAKFIQGRIHSAEQNIADLCNAFAQYCRKAARVRDRGDEITKVAINFAEKETINKSLAQAFDNFAECISNLGDYEDARVQGIENKVVVEFAKYEDICKHVKEEVKEIYAARDKEMTRRRQLDKIRERNPRNRQQILQAEAELVKATAEVSKCIHNLEEKTTSFEKQKLHDMKAILLDFIMIEIGYHAKSLEVLTKAYADVNLIDEETDLEELKRSLRVPDTIRHKSLSKSSMFRSSKSLGSLGAIFSTSHNNNNRRTGIPINTERISKSEETLDSMKDSGTDSDESGSESESDSDEDISLSDEKPSTPVIRRFKK